MGSKEAFRSAGDPGSIPGSGGSPGDGIGTSLQYSYLENSMDRGAWRATIHGVTESDATERLTLHFPGPGRTELHSLCMKCSLLCGHPDPRSSSFFFSHCLRSSLTALFSPCLSSCYRAFVHVSFSARISLPTCQQFPCFCLSHSLSLALPETLEDFCNLMTGSYMHL